ncbi:MAG: lamin tail domain-containing protein [Verrucomicrobia bacterium]|nr:lamin tail domain-containing protein [Verrucomicrobiota bacterium]
MSRRACPAFLSLLLLSAELVVQAQSPGVFISEVMPANTSTLKDEDGAFSDWLEIQNATPLPVNLLHWSLTDSRLELTKWLFPSVTIAPGGYLLVFASGKNRASDAAHLHTNFRLNAGGGWLALVKPDGATVASSFEPDYPATRNDVSFGTAQNQITQSLLAGVVPQILIPTNAASLPADWASPGFKPDARWIAGWAPAAIGFDTNQPAAIPANLARSGSALQSTSVGTNRAQLAIDGAVTDFTQTLATDTAPFWQVTLSTDASIQSVVLRNRSSGCCASRLRDITIDIMNTNRTTTNFTSSLLNGENAGRLFPAGPDSIVLDLVQLAGGPVDGQVIRVSRRADPDLSGSGGQGGSDEIATLSLAEVEVNGIPKSSTDVNLARVGNPAPTATQSTTLGGYAAGLAINGLLTDFTHTLGTDANPFWMLNLGRMAWVKSVTLYNRGDGCCGSRLRDITVEVLAADTNTVLYQSPLLNAENARYTAPAGPDKLAVELSDSPVIGQFVRVRRTPDPDLSGSGGQGDGNEGAVISLGEVSVLGSDVAGYRPYIRTDLQAQMLGRTASAFARLPFVVTDPSALNALSLRVRYDDGFILYLNGVRVLDRNAPAVPAWNSTATAKRDVAQALAAETIDLFSSRSLLVPGANVLAVQVLNTKAADGNLLFQPELVSTVIESSPNAFLSSPTPGQRNESAYYFGEVADTRFSVDRGFFDAPFSLSITSATPDAVIYYSVDCAEPEPGRGQLYTGPITITNTTVLRARAFRDQWKPSNVDTHTYLFLADVIHQAPTGAAPPHFPATWGANSVDYGMDPNVVNLYTLAEWKEALTQIPSVSIVTEMENLFDASSGIYANALQHGSEWERPGSIELLDPTNAVPGRFQENCGLRVRGGYSRNVQYVKHSLRVFFRSEYGVGKLRYPMFEDQGATEFDGFDLRSSQNYAWSTESDPSIGKQETMVREVFSRQTLGALGQPYRRSRYYHLYLNGQYWGLYETDERPEASYGATYLGGNKEDYDVVKCGNHAQGFVTEATDGTMLAFSNLWSMARSLSTNASNARYFSILGRNADGSRNPALPVMVDVDNLIDYMLVIFYTGDGDATLSSFLGNAMPNNWFGMRDRTNPDRGFIFFNSDAEHTLGAANSQVDRTGPFPSPNQNLLAYANPQWIHEDLMRNAEYRLRFADHVQRHFFNGGALTSEAGVGRFMGKASQITRAIRAYSARWGDAKKEPPYLEADWYAEITNIVRNWFPPRTVIVLQQLKDDSLYPAVKPPAFSQLGGNVPAGYALEITQGTPGATLFYTLDGSDPRRAGGAAGDTAQVYAGPIAINAPTQVRARVLSGKDWSAVMEATFFPPQDLSRLVVSELMYAPLPDGLTDGAEFEFIELHNAGPTSLRLAGLQFTRGITYTFSADAQLAAGGYLILARNPAAFAKRYPGVAVYGKYEGKLDNAGETIALSHPLGGTVFSFSYEVLAPWPATAREMGFSLVFAGSDSTTMNDPAVWRASGAAGGSPGAVDPTPAIPRVLVNEALTHSPLGSDYIELFNPTSERVDIGGWFLTDDPAIPGKFTIPSSTTIAPFSYALFAEPEFNNPLAGTNAFALSSRGDSVYIFSADTGGRLTGFSHGFAFGAAPQGGTLGRMVISTGEEQFALQTSATPLDANAGPLIGPVVITEIHYNPAAPALEFIELKNISLDAVPLFDPAHPTNTWRLSGVGYDFPLNTTLAPGEIIVMAPVTPAAFRAQETVPAKTRIFGPYSGALQDSGERIDLQRPDLPDAAGVAYITVDGVRYNDHAPWPPEADGAGPSLQRKNPLAYGNDPANWQAALSTPGTEFIGGSAPALSSQPQGRSVRVGERVVFSVGATGPGPLRFQWRFNGAPLDSGAAPDWIIDRARPQDAGNYSVVVFNEFGAVASGVASLTVLQPPTIYVQPANQYARPGAKATFTVVAAGDGPVRYQWRFQGKTLDLATSASLVVTNVQLKDVGTYQATVQDRVGGVESVEAALNLLIDPLIVQNPVSQPVIAGSSVILSVEVTNTATLPIGYRWRRNDTNIPGGFVVLNDRTSFFTVTNVQATATNFSVLVTNLSRTAGFISAKAFLAIVEDKNGDGVSDAWEAAFGFGAGNLSEDFDHDGMSNLQEYLAGTNPTNALSVLRLRPVGLGGGVSVAFDAVSNHTYSVQYSEALPAAQWLRWVDFSARGSNWTPSLPVPLDGPQRYLRVVTPRQ